MKLTEIFLNLYLLICVSFFVVGCGEWFLGKTPEQIKKEIDINKDGKITEKEIKASVYDTNKDGILSKAEMTKATEPESKWIDGLLAALAGLNIPLVLGVKHYLNEARKNKGHVYQLIGDIQSIKKIAKSSEKLDLDTIVQILKDSKVAYEHGSELTGIVKVYKGK